MEQAVEKLWGSSMPMLWMSDGPLPSWLAFRSKDLNRTASPVEESYVGQLTNPDVELVDEDIELTLITVDVSASPADAARTGRAW